MVVDQEPVLLVAYVDQWGEEISMSGRMVIPSMVPQDLRSIDTNATRFGCSFVRVLRRWLDEWKINEIFSSEMRTRFPKNGFLLSVITS